MCIARFSDYILDNLVNRMHIKNTDYSFGYSSVNLINIFTNENTTIAINLNLTSKYLPKRNNLTSLLLLCLVRVVYLAT